MGTFVLLSFLLDFCSRILVFIPSFDSSDFAPSIEVVHGHCIDFVVWRLPKIWRCCG